MSICCFATRYVFATLKLDIFCSAKFDICSQSEQSICFSLRSNSKINRSESASSLVSERVQIAPRRLDGNRAECVSTKANALRRNGVYATRGVDDMHVCGSNASEVT